MTRPCALLTRRRALRSRARHPRRGRHGQRGAALVEVLVASALMAPLIVAAAAGLITGIRASANAELTQRLGVELTAVTEHVKAMPYLPCGTTAEYQAAYDRWTEDVPPSVANGRAAAARIVAVRYWDRDSSSYVATCARDGGAQRITVAAGVDDRVADADIVTRAPAGPRSRAARP